jgi:hypothetical protein
MKDTTYYCVELKQAHVTVYLSTSPLKAQAYADAHPECVLVEK